MLTYTIIVHGLKVQRLRIHWFISNSKKTFIPDFIGKL